jgi:hypothetical protein
MSSRILLFLLYCSVCEEVQNCFLNRFLLSLASQPARSHLSVEIFAIGSCLFLIIILVAQKQSARKTQTDTNSQECFLKREKTYKWRWRIVCQCRLCLSLVYLNHSVIRQTYQSHTIKRQRANNFRRCPVCFCNSKLEFRGNKAKPNNENFKFCARPHSAL